MEKGLSEKKFLLSGMEWVTTMFIESVFVGARNKL